MCGTNQPYLIFIKFLDFFVFFVTFHNMHLKYLFLLCYAEKNKDKERII
ncbi:conserved protein of unknown function [Bacillus velezensis]|nr:hypothetical protein U722_01810 [Bacillus amyloliquefaciens LFB112]ERK81837.1 hypothetical protein N786_17355 [Bacillus amyloliquefaciens UASWS BA1]CUX92231.1 conserved protein of unknown function [Bacillus velezensis]